jgi:hypothetical protein
VIAVLAQPEALLVFAAIVVATSTARPLDRMGDVPQGTRYITPFGLAKDTSLSRAVIERAAAQLKRVGMLDVLPDQDGRYESWRSTGQRWSPRPGESTWVLLPGSA